MFIKRCEGKTAGCNISGENPHVHYDGKIEYIEKTSSGKEVFIGVSDLSERQVVGESINDESHNEILKYVGEAADRLGCSKKELFHEVLILFEKMLDLAKK
jgi:hypothetical protein